ncbi:MAG: YdcH family protein [Burkholderiaceae bacterium]
MSLESELLQRISDLETEHRALDEHLQGLLQARVADQLMLQRLKKRKLALKDAIVALRMQLEPDVPA